MELAGGVWASASLHDIVVKALECWFSRYSYNNAVFPLILLNPQSCIGCAIMRGKEDWRRPVLQGQL